MVFKLLRCEIVFSVLVWFTFSAGRLKFPYLVNQFPFKWTGKPGCNLRDISRLFIKTARRCWLETG